MRKRHLFTLLFLSTLVGMTSCDDSFLDQTVTTDLDETTVFADSTYTSGFLSQIYSDVGFDVDMTALVISMVAEKVDYRLLVTKLNRVKSRLPLQVRPLQQALLML